MLAAGRAGSGGDAPNIRWNCSTAEAFEFRRPYGIAIAAESFHWMDAAAVMRRLAPAIDNDGRLVLIGRGESAPWSAAFRALIPRYSVIRDYRAMDVPADLSAAALWEHEDQLTTPGEPFQQSVDDYIALQHSRSAFARHRMEPALADEFDEAIRKMLRPYAAGGFVGYDTSVSMTWGRPAPALRDTLTL